MGKEFYFIKVPCVPPFSCDRILPILTSLYCRLVSHSASETSQQSLSWAGGNGLFPGLVNPLLPAPQHHGALASHHVRVCLSQAAAAAQEAAVRTHPLCSLQKEKPFQPQPTASGALPPPRCGTGEHPVQREPWDLVWLLSH